MKRIAIGLTLLSAVANELACDFLTIYWCFHWQQWQFLIISIVFGAAFGAEVNWFRKMAGLPTSKGDINS